MDGDKTFEQVILLSKASLEIVLLQHEVIVDLVGKLKKYEDVTEYEQLLAMLNGLDKKEEEQLNEDK